MQKALGAKNDWTILVGEPWRLRGGATIAVSAAVCAMLSASAIAAPAQVTTASLSLGDPVYRDCVFARAGLARWVLGLDHLDRDMMFLAAARDTPDDFMRRNTETDPPHPYVRLLSQRGAADLQRLVKAHGACRTRSGQVLKPWPLESGPAR